MEILKSRKFQAMIVGLVVTIGGKYGLDLDTEVVAMCVTLIVAFIVGQAVSDHGVAPAKIAAQTKTVTTVAQEGSSVVAEERKEVAE